MGCDSAVDILCKAGEPEDLNIQFEHYIGFIPIKKPLHFSRMKQLVLRSSAGLLPTISVPLHERRMGQWSYIRSGIHLPPGRNTPVGLFPCGSDSAHPRFSYASVLEER